jgi:ethanolaminephosphotransferase
MLVGVDALNTTLEVLIFSATMNYGQTWLTVLIQFAGEFSWECLRMRLME